MSLYDPWAADYDRDVFEVMEFIGTDRIADLLAAHVPDRDQPVIDLGCGTGAAGTFTTGHVGADAIPALVSLLQPGAVVAWVIAEPLWSSFRESMAQHGLDLVHAALEPVRRHGPPESMMVVARLQP